MGLKGLTRAPHGSKIYKIKINATTTVTERKKARSREGRL